MSVNELSEATQTIVIIVLTAISAFAASFLVYFQILKSPKLRFKIIDNFVKGYRNDLRLPLVITNKGAKPFYAFHIQWEITEVDGFVLRIEKIGGKKPFEISTLNLSQHGSEEFEIYILLKANDRDKVIPIETIDKFMRKKFKVKILYNYYWHNETMLYDSESIDITKSVINLLDKHRKMADQ